MQSFQFKFDAQKRVEVAYVKGNFFVYESATNQDIDHRITVKPSGGAEVILKSGQQFRPSQSDSETFTFYPTDPAANIQGVVIIGSGDFYDANINTSFKLDASFANEVTVKNINSEPVPVNMVAGGGGILAYTKQYKNTVSFLTKTAVNMVTALENVSGVIINRFSMLATAASAETIVILANEVAPVSKYDGDVLLRFTTATGAVDVKTDLVKDGQIKVPAGKAVWLWVENAAGVVSHPAELTQGLFTVL